MAPHGDIALRVQTLRDDSFFAEAISAGSLAISGAIYELDSGLVNVTVP